MTDDTHVSTIQHSLTVAHALFLIAQHPLMFVHHASCQRMMGGRGERGRGIHCVEAYGALVLIGLC
jgi:hypothetical protein